MKIALKKGVRGAISQKAALGILIDVHQIHLFIIPVYEELSKFTEMQVTPEMNCVHLILGHGSLNPSQLKRGRHV